MFWDAMVTMNNGRAMPAAVLSEEGADGVRPPAVGRSCPGEQGGARRGEMTLA